jgi:hypothetical protein
MPRLGAFFLSFKIIFLPQRPQRSTENKIKICYGFTLIFTDFFKSYTHETHEKTRKFFATDLHGFSLIKNHGYR